MKFIEKRIIGKSIGICLALGASCIMGLSYKPTPGQLSVYFMRSFDNDSIKISTPSTSFSLRATGIVSIADTTQRLLLPITNLDTTITIKDIVRDKSYTVPLKRDNKYLFIYYNQDKFIFRFSNKLLFKE